MRRSKPKLKAQIIYNHSKEYKMFRYALNKTCRGYACFKLENFDDRNQKRPK